MSRPMIIKGGRVIDPGQGLDGTLDVLLNEDGIIEVAGAIDTPEEVVELDASGMIVTPGLIDVHVHLREPGGEHKETIETGSLAAVAGGFTSICAMPNTDPPVDDPAAVGFVKAMGERVGAARVYPVGAISVGLAGTQLAEVGEMVEAGAVAITDDGNPVMDSGLMRMALEYTQAFGIPVADHPEDLGVSGAGVMNESVVSTRLGLRGKPSASEDIHIVRDLLLAGFTGGRIHLQHISTAYGVDAIRQAKARGVRVTAEATPHHLLLTDEAVDGYRTDAKMNPPLRGSADRAAVQEGLADGTLDTIATDHAPHHYDEKERAFDDAPFGIVGLETSLGLIMTHVVGKGIIDLPTMVDRMSRAPAEAFGLPGGSLTPGSVADLTIIDPAAEWTIDRQAFRSKSHNQPFDAWELKGRARYTIVGGRIVFEGEA